MDQFRPQTEQTVEMQKTNKQVLLGRVGDCGGGGESVCYKSALSVKVTQAVLDPHSLCKSVTVCYKSASVKVTQETSFFSTLHTGPLDHSHANVKIGRAFGKYPNICIWKNNFKCRIRFSSRNTCLDQLRF